MASICVFIASSLAKAPYTQAFIDESIAVGRLIAERRHALVMGGISSGSMKMVGYDGYLQNGGHKLTVIYPEEYASFERAIDHISVFHLPVANLTRRLELMHEESDAFILMPGGIGSIHEGALNIADNQALLYHPEATRLHKPMVIYNYLGFYNQQVGMYDTSHRWGFIKDEHMPLIQHTSNRDEVLPLLEGLLAALPQAA